MSQEPSEEAAGHDIIKLGYILRNNRIVVEVNIPDGILAGHIVAPWANFASHLGFHGIHWSNVGNFRGCVGCDWRTFLTSASQTLAEHGMVQNLEFVNAYSYHASFFAANTSADGT